MITLFIIIQYMSFPIGNILLVIKLEVKLTVFTGSPPRGWPVKQRCKEGYEKGWWDWSEAELRQWSATTTILILQLLRLSLLLLLLRLLLLLLLRRSNKLILWLGKEVRGRGGRRYRLRRCGWEGLLVPAWGWWLTNYSCTWWRCCTSVAIKRKRLDRFWQTKAYINPWNIANTDILTDFM